jgi:hypothetical protein
MLDFLSYLWWRVTRRGPGLSPDDPIPYIPTDTTNRASSGGLVYLIPDWRA